MSQELLMSYIANEWYNSSFNEPVYITHLLHISSLKSINFCILVRPTNRHTHMTTGLYYIDFWEGNINHSVSRAALPCARLLQVVWLNIKLDAQLEPVRVGADQLSVKLVAQVQPQDLSPAAPVLKPKVVLLYDVQQPANLNIIISHT